MGGRRLNSAHGSRAARSPDSQSQPLQDWAWQLRQAPKGQPPKTRAARNQSGLLRSPLAASAQRASTTRSQFTFATHVERGTARAAAHLWTMAQGNAQTAWLGRDAANSPPSSLRQRSSRSRPPLAVPPPDLTKTARATSDEAVDASAARVPNESEQSHGPRYALLILHPRAVTPQAVIQMTGA